MSSSSEEELSVCRLGSVKGGKSLTCCVAGKNGKCGLMLLGDTEGIRTCCGIGGVACIAISDGCGPVGVVAVAVGEVVISLPIGLMGD